jgi:RHS repeat-associated protein
LGKTTDYTYDGTHGGILTMTSPPATSGAIRPQARYSYTALSAWYKNSAGALVQAVSPVYLLTGTSTCQTTASCSGAGDEAKTAISYQAGSSSVGSNLLPLSTSAGSGTTPVMTSSSMTYDIVGNGVTRTDPLSNMSYIFYDADREMTGAISPDPDGAGTMKRRAVRLTYNADGQVITSEEGSATGTAASDLAGMTVLRKTDVSYDVAGRKAKDALTAGGTLYAVTQYSYDGAGRLECNARRMNPNVFGSLPSSACALSTAGSFGTDRISRNVYDAAGQLLKVQTGYGTSAQRDEVTNGYTNNGKASSVTDANGNKTSYAYDGFDRLSKTNYPNPSSAGSSSSTDYEQLTYDAGSRVTQRRLRDGQSIGFGYDDLGRVTSKTFSAGDATISYTYDLLGRRGTVTRGSSGIVLTYGFDVLSRLLYEWQPFGSSSSQYDVAGRRTRLTWNDGYYVTYDYDNVGEMAAIRENGATSGVGVLATFSYDDLGQRLTLARGNGTSTTGVYDYGAAPRLGCMWQDLNGGTTQAACSTTPTASGQDQEVNFAYNPASQITRRTSANDAYAWTQSYNVNRGYTANGLNQYTASGSITPTYDARGNLTSAGGTTYGYTSENELLSATGATAATFGYDGLGRIVEYDTSVSTRFVYDGPNIIAEVANPSGSVLRRYVHGPGDDEPLVWYEGSGTTDRRWLHADERGSIIAVTDGSGNAIAINSYDSWGISQTTNLGRFQYTGQVWLPELGLYSYKARIYSATLGRFLQTDPIGYGDGLNWYNYAHGDPIDGRDPTGEDDDFKWKMATETARGTGSLSCDGGSCGSSGGVTTPGNTATTRGAVSYGGAQPLCPICQDYLDSSASYENGDISQGQFYAQEMAKLKATLSAAGGELASGLVVRAGYMGLAKLIGPSTTMARAAGVSAEGVARVAVSARNALKVGARWMSEPTVVREMEARNMLRYGNKIGPTADQLFAKYGSWEKVIRAASRTAGLFWK